MQLRRRIMGEVTPVEITVFADRSFTFITKTPPASYLLKQAAKIKKGSGVPNREKVARIKKDLVFEIARKKMQDLNTKDEDMAFNIIAGTARSMGIDIVE